MAGQKPKGDKYRGFFTITSKWNFLQYYKSTKSKNRHTIKIYSRFSTHKM